MKKPSIAAAAQKREERTVIEAVASPLVLQMIPSVHRHQGRHDDQVQLATMMRSLVLDQRHPIALEVTGTHQQRSLLIRVRHQDDFKHVETQLQARLPQASFVPLVGRDDPFHLSAGETVSVVELCAGQASYLPLQNFERMNKGEDPILGILGALDALPADLRAIAQIALVPAPTTWSRGYQRKAIEHALEPERQRDRQNQATARGDGGAPSVLLLLMGGLFLVGYLLFQQYPKLLPAWFIPTVQALIMGKWLLLWSGPHHLELEAMVGVLVLMLLVPLLVRRLWSRLLQVPLYEMRDVAEKTARSAYQVRLRLYVIGPCAVKPSGITMWQYFIKVFCRIGSAGGTVRCAIASLSSAGQWRATTKVFSMLLQLVQNGSLTLFGMLKQRGVSQWQYWQANRLEYMRRRQILARLIAAYRQYHLASGNYFVPRRVSTRRARSWMSKGFWWKNVQRSRHVLDVETLGALWHVPTDEALPDLAHITYSRSRSRLLPPSLEVAQSEPAIGFSEHAGHRVSFGIPADCLQSHLLIGGKSGEGKSTLMLHLARRSMREDHGLIVIDPHGDLVEHVLSHVPPERRDDVVLIDLSDERFVCGINPIDTTVARGRDKAISDLIKILSHIWASAWGSRMEIACEYALRTLYEANKVLCKQGKQRQQYTLLDVMTILTNESFCHTLLEDIHDPFILRWWAIYFDPLSLQMQRDRIDPVLSKMAKFEGMVARHIVGQSLCTVDFHACIEQKKILLIKLAKPLVGEDVARILGATLLGFLTIAFEEQGKNEEAQRQHVPILIDEFQTLEGVDWGAMAELRKYGATFCLATQSLEYLREKQILPVVLANVKQLAIFRMSADDAWMLHRELEVDPEDIVNLDTLTCYLKLVHLRRQHPTFSCKLNFSPQGEKEQVQQIRLDCQHRYMRPISDIDTEIFERLARQISAVPSGGERSLKEIITTQKEGGQARQNGGNRGRKTQEKRAEPHPEETGPAAGKITTMNWKETVGLSEPDPEEEQEVDPGERT